ncbi:hypothetical protein EDB86DRAFT_3086583 [Lactarius hatsudake]|nr:hypothetical protein EDB86DRAFT_3086583 [Lactarius hatsudake]
MTSRTLLPPNASAEAAIPEFRASHMHPNFPKLNRRLHPAYPTQQPHSRGRRLEYPDRFPSLSPSLSRSSTPLDGLLLEAMCDNLTSPSSPPQNPKPGTSLISASWSLASNEDPFPQPPLTPPPRSSPPPHATVDAEPIRAQRGREKRQRCSSVGSVAASDVSGDGRVVMTFPQEAARQVASVAVIAVMASNVNCVLSAVSRSLVTRGYLLYRARDLLSHHLTNKSSITSTTSWQFKSILDAGSSEYKKKTENSLLDDWLVNESQSCDSAQDLIQHAYAVRYLSGRTRMTLVDIIVAEFSPPRRRCNKVDPLQDILNERSIALVFSQKQQYPTFPLVF